MGTGRGCRERHIRIVSSHSNATLEGKHLKLTFIHLYDFLRARIEAYHFNQILVSLQNVVASVTFTFTF